VSGDGQQLPSTATPALARTVPFGFEKACTCSILERDRANGNLHSERICTCEVRKVLDAEDRLQRAGVRAAGRFCFLPTGSWVAAPGALRAVDNPERSEFVNGDHAPLSKLLLEDLHHCSQNGTAVFVTGQQLFDELVVGQSDFHRA
jgi:hypothetical protein